MSVSTGHRTSPSRLPFILVIVLLAAYAPLTLTMDRAAWFPRFVSEDERSRMLATIDLYNKITEDLYASGGDPSLIDVMPTAPIVKHAIFRDIEYLSQSGFVLILDLASRELVDVRRLPGDRFRCLVREEWNYRYQSSDSRHPVSRVRGATSLVVYVIARDEDSYRIVKATPAQEDSGSNREPPAR